MTFPFDSLISGLKVVAPRIFCLAAIVQNLFEALDLAASLAFGAK